MTYNVFGGTLSITQSINQSHFITIFDHPCSIVYIISVTYVHMFGGGGCSSDSHLAVICNKVLSYLLDFPHVGPGKVSK